MAGCRAFSQKEIEQVLEGFNGEYALRDRALFLLGIRSGFRISELLSLRCADVFQDGALLERITVSRRHMKGRICSREVVLHPEAGKALLAWIEFLQADGRFVPDCAVFQSRKGQSKPISRQHAFKILQTVCRKQGISGRIGSHSMRKTFASRVYDKLDRNIFLVQKALGHKNIDSTVRYLSFRQTEIDQAILAA